MKNKCVCENVAGDNKKCKLHKHLEKFRVDLQEMIEFCMNQGASIPVMREAIMYVINTRLK